MIETLIHMLQQPADDGVTAKWIIGGMAGAIVALSGYIVKLHVKLNSVQEEAAKRVEAVQAEGAKRVDAIQAEWAKYMREQVDLVRTLNDEVSKPSRGGD